MAGFVLANGSMSSNQSGEGEIRQAIIEADLVDCMVALPGQLFYSTQIPVCLWFISRDKRNNRFKDRRGKVLFIDARKFGTVIDRVHRELTDDDIAKIAGTYHAWRGDKGAGKYEDTPGFCKGATREEIEKHGHVLTPGRYVGAEEIEDDGEPFQQKMTHLAKQMRQADTRGKDLGLSQDEVAFYDALETNDSAVKALGDKNLKFIAQELVKTIRENVSIDWTAKESVRAKLRVMVKKVLRRFGYPPDKQEKATQTVLQQAELLCAEWGND